MAQAKKPKDEETVTEDAKPRGRPRAPVRSSQRFQTDDGTVLRGKRRSGKLGKKSHNLLSDEAKARIAKSRARVQQLVKDAEEKMAGHSMGLADVRVRGALLKVCKTIDQLPELGEDSQFAEVVAGLQEEGAEIRRRCDGQSDQSDDR